VSGRAARVVAQAKINLFLRVLAREASGFHSIETLFQRLELGDDVVIRTTASGRALGCTGPAMPAGGLGAAERNLAYRAAVAYQEATGWPAGFTIEIEKRIPVSGGLGGGSADAGAVLRGLNALSPRPLTPTQLLALATPLGSDVPFLTIEAPLALAWGRGERMLMLPPLPPRRVSLALFDDGVPTAEAFRWLDESRGPYVPIASTLDPSALRSWDGIADVAENDFEPVVLPRFPMVARVRAVGSSWAETARRDRGKAPSISLMSGTGSTVYFTYDGRAVLDIPPDVASEGVRFVTSATSTRVADVEVTE
jgi:4-diphosphocytidyl-2-C-methyl-D-erythritol kinase